MSDPTMNDTQPNKVPHDTQPVPKGKRKNQGLPRWLVAVCIVLVIAVGLLAGYGSGMGERYAAQDTVVSSQLDDQFQLGTQAVEAGNFDRAKQYFEGIIKTNPNYPGIQAAYADLLIRMQITPTPVDTPTPYISPTPDLRGAEEIFKAAQQSLNDSDWSGALANLDSLRKLNPTYQTAQVDGMYYTALRQLGIQQITAGCKDANLEGGIYDLTLAEHFVGNGNLDNIAESLRTYARLYIIGASFWDQDWKQAQSFFEQVMAAYPNMSDSSCQSATNRYVEATINVAQQLLASGDTCGAEEQFNAAFNINSPYNATAYPTATAASDKCNGGSKPTATETTLSSGTATITLTATPTGGNPVTPIATNPPTPTETPTIPPAESPTPTPSPTCDASLGTPCP
jgi:tetratricopeptide (TPR) repeat protein